MNHSTPGLPVHQQLPEFTQTHVHLILCHPLLLLPPIPPSIRVFSNESTLRMRWPEYCSFSFSIIPSEEHPGLISFRMDWLDLLAVQGTLKSLLQHHSSKASVLWCSTFFTVQLSHPYMTTGKTIALTRWAFVGKVISLLFNMLSRLVITFLPRSKQLLIRKRLGRSIQTLNVWSFFSMLFFKKSTPFSWFNELLLLYFKLSLTLSMAFLFCHNDHVFIPPLKLDLLWSLILLL